MRWARTTYEGRGPIALPENYSAVSCECGSRAPQRTGFPVNQAPLAFFPCRGDGGRER